MLKNGPQKRTNQKIYIKILRQMSSEQRLMKFFELSSFSRQLYLQGLHKRFPDLPDDEFQKILQERLDKCPNRNY